MVHIYELLKMRKLIILLIVLSTMHQCIYTVLKIFCHCCNSYFFLKFLNLFHPCLLVFQQKARDHK